MIEAVLPDGRPDAGRAALRAVLGFAWLLPLVARVRNTDAA
jgi:hypothetical protein